jgi:hypothetical protein
MSDEKLLKILRDFPLFAENFLNIRTKSGQVKPFILNRAQLYIHERIENQKKATGRVRALILKGRQQGCSTYVQGRDLYTVVTTRGKKAFILTHEAEATKNLFDMTKRFYDGLPEGLIPKPDTSSAKELKFDALDSSYAVGTAGNRSVGRSQTIQIFHGSEVAYWPSAEEHAKGILQAVPNEEGTEIILESTANGIGNYFYNMWVSATTGESEFQAIFIPWYWQPEYTRNIREMETISLSEEEQELLDTHKENGLTANHLYWRRTKISEFGIDYESSKELFNAEYPMTALDAFRNPVTDRFIKANVVNIARKNKVDSDSPLVIGVDPAVSDKDRLAIIRRKGRKAYKLETHFQLNTMEIVGLVRRIIDQERPTKVLIDCIGIGAGIVDRLLELGYNCVKGVNVARSSDEKSKFRNKRAELWWDMREWLAQEMPVEIPDSDELMGDLTSLGYKYDSAGRLVIESKDDLRKRGMKSPDTADALALTFYMGDYLSGGSFKPKMFPNNHKRMLI